MKLHLPVLLRKAIIACMLAVVTSFTQTISAATLTLGGDDSLSLDFADESTIPNLNNGSLQLSGDTTLQLSSCGEGDGKTYILLTGVSELLDAQGNVISLDSTNNAASRYFDTTQPGTGFWADATLQLTDAGTLQLVLHNETVKEAITITSRKSNPSAYQYYAGIAFEDISNVSSSDAYGGAIYGSVRMTGNGDVSFSGNTAESASSYSYAYGGAIYGSTIKLSDNGSVSFSGNTASSSYSDSYAYGGAIYGSTIKLSDNGSVSFSGNTAESASFYSYASGGAIYGSTITLSGNGSVSFSENTAYSSSYYAFGGAIYGDSSSTITLSDNGSVIFSGNTAYSSSSYAFGGAIYGDSYSTITLSNNGSVSFNGNTVSSSSSDAYGGAIDGDTITLSDNGSVIFSGNTASASFASGGAIYGSGSTITLSDNGSVIFSGNTASASSASGGAIYGGTITLSDNGSVVFEGNTASSSDSYAYGGAISGGYDSTITLSDNRSVTFSGNTASGRYAYGGAIYGDYYSTITLSDNGSVTFSGNTAHSEDYSAYDGAIYTRGDLSIRNNDSVEFYQNAEVNGNTYRLRSIYAYGNEISLSAAAGKSITFYDSVYIGSDATVNLNQDYTYQAEDGSSVTIRQQGDIIFTGKYTELHLNDLLEAAGAGRTATAQEILNSRTTVVNAMTNLYGGRLRVEEGAIYQGRGITAMEGSGATVRVKNATLIHEGYDLTFNAGTTLELVGTNIITGNVQMQEGSNLSFDASETTGQTWVDGDMFISGTLTIANADTWSGENALLFWVSGNVTGWDEANITVMGQNTVTLVDNDIMLNYNAETYNKYVNGNVTYTSGSQVAGWYYRYEEISFENITSSSSGSAIYGGSDGTILLSRNRNVVFEGNTASSSDDDAYGGAIYGDEDSTITLSNNGSVTFSGNTASSSDSYAYGGAISGDTITLSNNGSVTFSGNTASGRYAYDSYVSGGAIDASGDLSIRNNDSVEFYQNAEVVNGNTYRLRSIYADGGSGDEISLSAAAGKSITFYDSVYIGSDATVNLNQDYTYQAEDGTSVTIKQQGDIVFTGAYAEQHLNDLLEAAGAGRTATAQEILNSRTTVVNAMTNLYGGRLRVEEGAIYQGRGITAKKGSGTTVRVQNATLIHEGYDLTFNAGTTLELAGNNTITGNVQMLEGSSLLFDLRQYQGVTIHRGRWNVADDALVCVALDSSGGTGEWGEIKTIALLNTNADLSASRFDLSISPLTGNWGYSGLQWVEGTLSIAFKNGATDAVWTNATGDFRWNNESCNWTDSGFTFARVNGADVTFGKSAEGSILLDGQMEVGKMTVSADAVYALDIATGASLTVQKDLVLGAGSDLTVHGNLAAAGVNGQGNLVVDGELNVTNAVTASSIQAGSLLADSLNLTNAENRGSITGDATVAGEVVTAGHLNVGGSLTASFLQAASLEVGSLVLTAGNTVNTVTGNLMAESVSMVAGSSLAVGGVLTTDEVQMSGTALTLTAGSFGAAAMNFELDRAALESLGLAHGATAVIARTTASLTEEVAVTLNGTTDFVQAAAYEYKISAVGNTVQVLADYAHEGMKVWYRGAWVGDSSWADYHIAGYDAVDGVENVNLCNRSYSGDMLIVTLEQGVHSAVITGAELEFANVDLGGGELVLGAGSTLTATEIYGPGETLSVLENAALHADAVQLGVLHLVYTDVSLKDASIGAITGTTGKLTIARNGKVTVNSDVELGSFLNEGYLNVGSHNLTVNALTDKGGNVTAGEVSVQCRASRMAEFDMLIADRVTVTNNVAGARYTDDIVLGDGSVVGELLADKLVVKGGTVTLGSTTAETVQNVHALELQNGATLILNQTFVELGEDFVASDGSSIQLEEGGHVLRGHLGVSSLEEALVLDATTLTGDGLPSTLSNARMTAYGDDAARYDGLLLDSAVVNEGSGTFSVNNSGNALVEIEACRGDVLVYNVPIHALRKLDIADGKTVSAYSAGTAHAAYEASVVLNGTARIGRSARLNANLVVKSGSSLNLAGSLTMGSSLELESGLTLGGVVFSSLQSAQSGAVIGLFNGVDELTLAGQKYNAISLSDGVLASVVFSNLENNGAHEYYFVYDSATQGEGELGICYNYNDNYVTPDEPEIPDTPVTPDEPEIPDTPVTPDEPEIPDAPVTPDEPEKPQPLKPLRPGAKPVLVGGDIDKNTEIILTEKGNVTLEGKVNAGAITVNSDKSITFKSNKKKPGSLAGDGDLTKKGKGTLTLNDGNGNWTGDTYLLAGTIKVKGTTSLGKGDVYVKGGTLNLGSKAIANDIVQSANAAIKSGKKFAGSYTLEKGELLKGSTLNIAKVATLEGGTVNGTLTGNGKTTVTDDVKLGDKGKITTKALSLDEDATLTTSAKGLSSKATTLTIGEDALFSLGGKMTVDSLKLNGGELKTTASKPAAMTVKNNMELTDATLTTNGKVTTNRLTLSESTMSIKGAKAQNLTVKQSLTLGSGSNLRLNGKLSAGSLTIRSGGTLTMSGSKPVTLKVKGALTLNSGSSIIMDYDFVQGKTYKLLTFGTYSGTQDYYSIFGVDADDCTITNTGKALTLTVTGKWNPQTQQKAVAAEAPVVAAAKNNPVADAMVQSNWGQLEASRAFVNAMANRSMAVQLGNGERAVWASAIGASSRHSSAGGHAGADTNVSGGAFGLETQVGRASLFGMALGNSWTRVSAHGFGTIEQDTTHLGLYGQTNWRSGVTADWSAAYGRSDSETMGTDWSQKQLQLDGRVIYNHELNANTVLSPFAGVQYYASDSASIGTTDTGSLQNLRAEIGVAASRRMGKFGVYGEIALHQDMARNNPSVSMEGVRYIGMNPGRTGLNFTVGASYELSDKWSVNASYTGEFVENANAHSANVGATYKF